MPSLLSATNAASETQNDSTSSIHETQSSLARPIETTSTVLEDGDVDVLLENQTAPLIPNYNETDAISVPAEHPPDVDGEDAMSRKGTLSSARLNILSTMVGGGSLSVPLAFHQAGNAFLGPLLLILIAFLVKQSIHLLVNAAILSHPQDDKPDKRKLKGNKSFESVTSHAFGTNAQKFTMALLSTICFLTIVGYAVLLRDMLLPLSDMIFGIGSEDGASTGPTFHHNITMLVVIFFVTPLCTLRDLTPLEKVGAVSMLSIFTVACCITYRSVQCNFSSSYDDKRLMEWYDYMNYIPETKQGFGVAFHALLNSLPILLSVFMCHFNVLPVHNELAEPTPKRVKALFSSSIWGACIFYVFVGFSGSMYGNCTPDGVVEGNVLLSFDEDDVLLMVGKICLSLTITAAFPILVVPCRDVILRALAKNTETEDSYDRGEVQENGHNANINNLAEPLLDESNTAPAIGDSENAFQRRLISVIIFWSGAAIACCVESIDIVWDILGGSLSLIMGFILPSASYIVISKLCEEDQHGDLEDCEGEENLYAGNGLYEESISKPGREFASFLVFLFIPMMMFLTANAIFNLA